MNPYDVLLPFLAKDILNINSNILEVGLFFVNPGLSWLVTFADVD
jgi:hypothetical protein